MANRCSLGRWARHLGYRCSPHEGLKLPMEKVFGRILGLTASIITRDYSEKAGGIISPAIFAFLEENFII